MKTIGITSTFVISAFLGTAALAFAAQDHSREKQDNSPQQNTHQQARPAQQQPQQQRQQQVRPPQQQPQQQRQQQPRPPQAQQQRQQQPRPPQQAQQQRQQQARGNAQRSPQQRVEVQHVWQQHQAANWQSDHRTWQQRGGYQGVRIPDDRFRGYFGQDHGFRIGGLPFMVVGGFPRFQYNGYWISVVDPWPAAWGNNWYNNDDVYVDYVDNGYYLFNRRYPGMGIAISISM